MEPKLFVATKAFIIFQNKVLILRESKRYEDGTNAGHYDVVGGRIKPGQSYSESLLREIDEETGLKVKMGNPFYVKEWRPIVKGEPWQIVGIYFECFADNENIKLSEDHDDFQWIEAKDYKNYSIFDDLKLVFEKYLEYSKK